MARLILVTLLLPIFGGVGVATPVRPPRMDLIVAQCPEVANPGDLPKPEPPEADWDQLLEAGWEQPLEADLDQLVPDVDAPSVGQVREKAEAECHRTVREAGFSDPSSRPCQTPFCAGLPHPPGPPVPSETRKAQPDIPLPEVTFLESVQHESINTSLGTHDWDKDGVIDMFDAINLPSEARVNASADDNLRLLQGLDYPGFALLVEPSHREAYLVSSTSRARPSLQSLPGPLQCVPVLDDPLSLRDAEGSIWMANPGDLDEDGFSNHEETVAGSDPTRADSTPIDRDADGVSSGSDPCDYDPAVPGPAIPGSVTITSQQALEFLAGRHGPNLTEAVATFLHENMTIHQVPVAPMSPVEVPLVWAAPAIPADGTWLLVRTNPTLLVELVIGGSPVALANRAASGVTASGSEMYRWEFLATHRGTSFCYDATIGQADSPCGEPAKDGWLRTFSGQAHYAIQSLRSGLAMGLLPVVQGDTPVLIPPDDAEASILELDRRPLWFPLGAVIEFDEGFGVDYQLVDDRFPLGPMVTQDSPPQAPQPRQFRFRAQLRDVTAEPRNLTSFHLGIAPADGNHLGQTFQLDGAVLAQALEREPGETWVAELGEATAGFWYRSEDLDLDGVLDLVVHIPHFSEQWLSVHTSDNPPAQFWDVDLISPTQGWITGGLGRLWRYQSGVLTAISVPGFDGYRTLGLHALSSTEFYVAGEGCMLAHYVASSGFKFAFAPSPACNLYDVWMKPDRSLGYAVGSQGRWHKFSSGTWPRQPFFTACGIMDIEVGADAEGYLAVNVENCDNLGKSGILEFRNGAITDTGSTGLNYMYDVDSPGGSYAVGLRRAGGGAGFGKRSGSTFVRDASVPDGHYIGVDSVPGRDLTFLVGSSAAGGALISKFTGSTGSVVKGIPGTDIFNDVDFASTWFGLAVGSGNLLYQYAANRPPVVLDTISATSGTSLTGFSGTDTGSYDTDGDPVSHEWIWGDGSGSLGPSASHRYDRTGFFDIVHRVTDNKGESASHSWTVNVALMDLPLGSISQSFSTTSPYQAHHYRLAASGVDRAVELSLTGTGLYLQANADAVAETPRWPQNGVVGASLVGLLPAGKALSVAVVHPASASVVSYSLTARAIPAPGAPSYQSTPTGEANQPLTLRLLASHPEPRSTALEMDWADGTPPTRFPAYGTMDPSTARDVSHTYAARGTFLVRSRTWDDLGQVGPWAQASITVRSLPLGSVHSPTGVSHTQATLQGSVLDLGGASSVQASFLLYRGGSLVSSSTPQTYTAPGNLAPVTVTGLLDGTTYSFRVRVVSDVGTRDTGPWDFATNTWIVVKPLIVAETTEIALGASASLTLKADSSSIYDVAYWVRWGDGTPEQRYPASGYVPWSQTVVATWKYAFPASTLYPVEIRLEDSSLKRSGAVAASARVTGTGPSANGYPAVQESRYDTAVLVNQPASLVYPSQTDFRFHLYSPVTWTWITSPWFENVNAGSSYAWTTPTLARGWVYQAQVEYRTDVGSTWMQESGSLAFQSNRAPILTLVSLPGRVSYLDPVHVEVNYRDPDGDAPHSSAGVPTPPTVAIGGVTYALHVGGGSAPTAAQFKAGVNYYYVVNSLASGRTHVAAFEVFDKYQAAPRISTRGVFVAPKSLVAFDLDSDSVGATPRGFSRSGDATNLWYVADSTSDSFPDRVALGAHGRVAWFGHRTRGTYSDPEGRTVRGSLTTGPVNLNDLLQPRLSFSSYFETENSTTRDMKRVQLLDANGWSVIASRTLGGFADGYGQWRTVAWDLSAWATQTVRFRFEFDSVDGLYNDRLGWLIDEVAVGEDTDRDGLADGLEDTRWTERFSPWSLPRFLGDQGTLRVPVPRLPRMEGDQNLVRALIGHARPSDLVIYLEVRFGNRGDPAAEGFDRQIQPLVNHGTVASSCGSGRMGSTVAPFGTAPAKVHAKGVEVRVDLASCSGWLPGVWHPDLWLLGFDGAQASWWLTIVDDRGGAAGLLEGLQVFDGGFSNSWTGDTDADHVLDGAEATLGRDPLSLDSDGDGDPDSEDPDVRMNWVPAFVVESPDEFRNEIRARVVDPGGPVLGEAAGLYVNGWLEFAPKASPGAGDWRWVMPRAERPMEVRIQLNLADGSTVTFLAGIQADPHRRGEPIWVHMILNKGTAAEEGVRRDLPASRINDPIVAFAGAELRSFLEGDFVVPIAERVFGRSVGTFLGAGEIVVMLRSLQSFTAISSQVVPNALLSSAWDRPAGFWVPSRVRDRVEGPGKEFSNGQLSLAVEGAEQYVMTEPYPRSRWIAPLPDGLAVLEVYNRVVYDAWKWEKTGSWDEGWTFGGDVPLGSVADREIWAGTQVLERAHWMQQTFCLAYCGNSDASELVTFTASRTDGESLLQQSEPLRLPRQQLQSLRWGYAAFDQAARQLDTRPSEAAIGGISLEFGAQLAEGRLLKSRVTSYWDGTANDGEEETDCSLPPASTKVRRCSSFTMAPLASQGSWEGEPLQPFQATWHRPGLLFQDALVGSDRVVTKGMAYPGQSHPDFGGRRTLEGVQSRLRDDPDEVNPSGSWGEARVAYDFQQSPAVHLAVRRIP